MRLPLAAARSTGLAATLAAAAMLIAMLLPGLHAWQIGPACGPAQACATTRDAAPSCCGHHHHHDDDEAHASASDEPAPRPAHDHHSCSVCKLIELIPAADPARWAAPAICLGDAPVGRVWTLAAPVFGLLDGRWTPSRGPPVA